MLSPRPAARRSPQPERVADPVLCLSLRALAEIGVFARVTQQLARRSLLPLRWHSTAAGEHLLLDIQIAGLDEDAGERLAESLRQVVGIEEVLTAVLQRQSAA
jgi:hypothetical protein